MAVWHVRTTNLLDFETLVDSALGLLEDDRCKVSDIKYATLLVGERPTAWENGHIDALVEYSALIIYVTPSGAGQ